MSSSSSHPNNNSPIRKQLAKRMINYYDQLSNNKLHDRSRSGSKERTNRSLSRTGSKELNTSKSGTLRQGSGDGDLYDENEHRRIKLHKLKELMLSEFDRAKGDGGLDPDFDTLEKLHKGYPSFMKEQETPEHMLEDHHNTNVKVFLNDKIDTFERAPEEDSYDSAEEDFVPESPTRSQLLSESKLYHIVVEQPLEISNQISENAFGFHQRKAKEIRRLQYAAGVGKKSKNKIRVVYYSVWILIKGDPVPALLGTRADKLKDSNDTLAITEDDKVKIKPQKDNKYKITEFEGKVRIPKPDEPECDFIAETEDGQRHPMWITLREKKIEKAQAPIQEVKEDKPIEKVQTAPPRPARHREVSNANCTLYDLKSGKKIGRAFVELSDKEATSSNVVKFFKGFLLDSNNKINQVLFKKLSLKECIIKHFKGNQSTESIVSVLPVEEFANKAFKVVLKKTGKENGAQEREIFYFEHQSLLEGSKIFEDEFIKAVCDNTIDYQGKIELISLEGTNIEEKDLILNYTDPIGRESKIKIVPDDDADNKLRMDKLSVHVNNILKLRQEANNAKLFNDHPENLDDCPKICQTFSINDETKKSLSNLESLKPKILTN